MSITIDNLRILESYLLNQGAQKCLLRVLDDVKYEVVRLEKENKSLAADLEKRNSTLALWQSLGNIPSIY